MNYTVDAPQDVIDGVKYEVDRRAKTTGCLFVLGLVGTAVLLSLLAEEPGFQGFLNQAADYFLK